MTRVLSDYHARTRRWVLGAVVLTTLAGCAPVTGDSRPVSGAHRSRSIRVDDFGATGGGLADDIGAIRKAITALRAGDTLVFTNGKTYLTSATVEVANKSDIALHLGTATIVTTAHTDASSVLLVQNCTNVRVSGGNLRHRSRSVRRNAADGLTINQCTDVVVSDVRVGYVYSMGIRSAGSNRVTVKNCVVNGSAADGIGAYGGQRQAVEPDAVIASGSRTLTSPNSYFQPHDIGSAITVYGAGVAGRDLVTTIASQRSTSQVVLAAPARTSVVRQFAKIQRPSTNISILGNRLINTGDDAISSVGYLSYAAPNANVTVRGNHIVGSGARGILLTGTTHGVITGNTLKRIKLGGVFLVVEVGSVTTWGCTDVVIDGNDIDTVGTGYPENNYPGVGAASTDDRYPIRNIRISNNIIRDAHSYYVSIGGYSAFNTAASTRDVVVRGNTCVGGNRNNPAVQVIKTTNVTVEGNRISDAWASAITVSREVVGRVVVQSNVITRYDRGSAGYPALDVNTRNPLVSNNVVDGVRIASGVVPSALHSAGG